MGGKYNLTGEVARQSLQVLKDITNLFDQKNIPYCLEGGTLLGIIREQRLLPWDNDMDLTITADHFEQVQSCLNGVTRKYRVRTRVFFSDYGPLKAGEPRLIKIRDRKFFFFRGRVQLDIFVKHSDGQDYYWVVGNPENHAIKSVPEKYYTDLTTYEFDGKQYRVPKDYRQYLTLRYGDWEQPVKQWNYLEDDQARVAGS